MKSLSLKTRLGLGAATLGLATVLAAAILWIAMDEVSDRLDKALASETRMDSYATLSNQAASYLVIATETLQTNLPADQRSDRLAPIEERLRRSFTRMQEDVSRAVEDARALGLDEQSRFGTQSLGLARMEALLESTSRALSRDVGDARMLRPHLDAFSTGFDPLLSQAVNNELLFRNSVLSDIETLHERLRLTAIGMAVLAVLAVALYYLLLIRPQFSRLDRLRVAARKIGEEDFEIALPGQDTDEIGQIYGETNRMVAALSARQRDVQDEWARLNETIAERTEALRTANATLAEIDENRRRFFADISHELRTPLTVILMEAQIGAQDGGDGVKNAFSTIETRASRLTRKIDDLLRVARSESGQLRLDCGPVALPGLLADVAAEIRAEVDTAGMTLDLGNAPEVALNADANWLRQVMVSLARNAIRHAREGGALAIGAEVQDAHAVLTVIDSGPGIPKADQAALFDRFTQGSGSTAAQGFGIGLALARWVVTEHGGEISVTSPLPRDEALGTEPGTKIAVRIPLTDA